VGEKTVEAAGKDSSPAPAPPPDVTGGSPGAAAALLSLAAGTGFALQYRQNIVQCPREEGRKEEEIKKSLALKYCSTQTKKAREGAWHLRKDKSVL